jgi:poly-gamma-glutamate synthesis protein (capsule biosynthesis protein)
MRDNIAPMPSKRVVLLAALVSGAALALATGTIVSLRDSPQPRDRTANPASVASIVAVGDILLDDAAADTLAKRGFDYPFENLAPLLGNAELVMGNLEGPITDSNQKFDRPKLLNYKQPPAVAQALRKAGFDLMVLGNNHAVDYGPIGLQDTQAHLERAGLRYVGAGADESAAREGLVVDLKGTYVGVLSYLESYGTYERDGWFAANGHPGVAKLDIPMVREDIARLRREGAQVVIVNAHYGRNYEGPTPFQREVSKQIIDAGADAVNGHHAHVALEVEVYAGKPIVYSVGNFTFGTNGRFTEDMPGYGYVARYNVEAGRLVSVEFDLIATDNRAVKFQPRLVGVGESRQYWLRLHAGLPIHAEWDGSTAIVRLSPTS